MIQGIIVKLLTHVWKPISWWRSLSFDEYHNLLTTRIFSLLDALLFLHLLSGIKSQDIDLPSGYQNIYVLVIVLECLEDILECSHSYYHENRN